MALEKPKTDKLLKSDISIKKELVENQKEVFNIDKSRLEEKEQEIKDLNSIDTYNEKISKMKDGPEKENQEEKKALLVRKFPELSSTSLFDLINKKTKEKNDIAKELQKTELELNTRKENLRHDKAAYDSNPIFGKEGLPSRRATKWTTYSVAAAAVIAGLFNEFKKSEVLSGNKDKNKTEQEAPKKDNNVTKDGQDITYKMPTPATAKKNNLDDNKDRNLNKARSDQERKIENLRKKNQDLANKLKDAGSKGNGSGESREERLEKLSKKLTKTSESDDLEKGSGYRGDVTKTINVVDQRTGKIFGKKTIVEKGAGPETGSQNLRAEEFQKNQENLVKVGKAEKHETTSQEKITDTKKIEALNKMSQIGKEAGFSEKEIVENIEQKSGVTLKKDKKATEHFFINGVELKDTGTPASEPKPGDNYYKHKNQSGVVTWWKI
jgi:hypothetical protein